MAPEAYLQRSARRAPVDDGAQLGDRPAHVVVRDDVVEVAGLLGLAARQLEALADLARALRGPLAEPPLELGEARRLDEDRHGVGEGGLDLLGAVGLELEHDAPPDERIRSTSSRSVPYRWPET